MLDGLLTIALVLTTATGVDRIEPPPPLAFGETKAPPPPAPLKPALPTPTPPPSTVFYLTDVTGARWQSTDPLALQAHVAAINATWTPPARSTWRFRSNRTCDQYGCR